MNKTESVDQLQCDPWKKREFPVCFLKNLSFNTLSSKSDHSQVFFIRTLNITIIRTKGFDRLTVKNMTRIQRHFTFSEISSFLKRIARKVRNTLLQCSYKKKKHRRNFYFFTLCNYLTTFPNKKQIVSTASKFVNMTIGWLFWQN